MNPTRAQLDAAEAWLLEEWREWLDTERFARVSMRSKRDQLATAIRAIRAQRKALEAVALIRKWHAMGAT